MQCNANKLQRIYIKLIPDFIGQVHTGTAAEYEFLDSIPR